MAAKWDIEFSLKENDVVVDNGNILADQRKAYKGLLVIKVFQVHVEVGVDKPPPKTTLLVKAAETAAIYLQDLAIRDVDALAKELMDLQQEEKRGNKKAAETGKKLVEKVEKSLKNMADEFGGDIRKAVQKALIGGTKQKLSSTSRTIFRGMILDRMAFEEDVEEEIPDDFAAIVKTLVSAGVEAGKQAGEEIDSRTGLVKAIETQKKAIDDVLKKSGKSDIDWKLFAKDNAKDVSKLSHAKDEYVDVVNTFEGKLKTALKALDKLQTLSDKEKALKDNKAVGREFADFRDAANAIVKTFSAKLKAAALVDDLFSTDWKGGTAFAKASHELGKQDDTRKDAKAMQEAGKALEKIGKG